MANESPQKQKARQQSVWHCQTCNRSIKAEQVVRRSWGSAIAIICPTCSQRLGEIRVVIREGAE